MSSRVTSISQSGQSENSYQVITNMRSSVIYVRTKITSSQVSVCVFSCLLILCCGELSFYDLILFNIIKLLDIIDKYYIYIFLKK